MSVDEARTKMTKTPELVHISGVSHLTNLMIEA
jgi:hypothetical protein